jgi:hypothetical protein
MTGRPFVPGNAAARGRRAPARTTPALIAAINDKLREKGEVRAALDFVAEGVLRIIAASTSGDLEASRWLVERFFPPEREAPIKIRGRLPSPTQNPAAYIDRVVRAVAKGEISTTQAARLANLATPFARDEVIRDALERLVKLEERVAQLTALRVVR